MLTCEQINDFLIDYLEGTMEEDMRRRFAAHTAKCQQCQRYLDQYRQTVAMVQEADEMPDPPEELSRKTLVFLQEKTDRGVSSCVTATPRSVIVHRLLV